MTRVGGAFGLSVLAFACNSISGSGDLEVGNGDDAEVAEAGVGPDGQVLPSETDGAFVPSDAAPDVIVDPPKACPSAGRICTPVAPVGWDGPLLVYDQATKAAPACPSSMALSKVDAHGGTPIGTHSCSACTCGAPAGVACNATYRVYDDDDCTDPVAGTQAISTVCKSQESTTESFMITGVSATGGSCVKGGGAAQLNPVDWPTSLLGCGAPSLLVDGCPDGQICAPEPAAPFRARHCIAQKGAVGECPVTWPQKLAGYEAVTDTRTCATCNCAVPTGVTCAATVQAYSNSGSCNGNAQTFSINSSACHGELESFSLRIAAAFTTTGGSCAGAGASAASGTVVPKDPVTVCCLAP